MRISFLACLYLSIGTVASAFLHQRNGDSLGNMIVVGSGRQAASTIMFMESSVKESRVTKENSSTGSHVALTSDIISKLRWRELHRELEKRDLSIEGNTSTLRLRLSEVTNNIRVKDSNVVTEDGNEFECSLDSVGVDFIDKSDPDFEYKDLLRQIMDRSALGHWKVASRRLRKLYRLSSNKGAKRCIPDQAYTATLQACAQDRLHGARAAETARKIMEVMVEEGYKIPVELINSCIRNSLGNDVGGTHEGFGGIDTALAMLSAANQQEAREGTDNLISAETYDRLIGALASEGGKSVDDALKLLRAVIVEKSETPLLSTFASVAKAQVLEWKGKKEEQRTAIESEEKLVGPEKVFNVLAYVKAAGYDLETIASTSDGRELLASGVIAADRADSVGVGLRLLQAASKASGCQPDRGDILVALSSPTAQRACVTLHKRAINTAVEANNWKLAVKLLELMLERALTPSTMVWRNVVTCCAKQEKSRKATALLNDWTELYKKGKVAIPPLGVFNTVLNACELCGEQDLTLSVLELMRETHSTDGNIITFNIALKRLARLGNHWAPEGIIVGMIESGIAPSVVSYTTAIAACAASEPKQPMLAYEWIKRMTLMDVKPNVITYNTAMAACLDGKLESTMLGSKIAQEMLDQVDEQLANEETQFDEFTSVIPDYNTKVVARQLMKQLKENWISGNIEKRTATSTLRVPLLALVEFSKSKAAQEAGARADARVRDVDELRSTSQDELALEYSNPAHRTAEV